MKRIAIDMDEVMADNVRKELRLYKEDFGTDMSKEQLWEIGKHLFFHAPKERRLRIMENYHRPGFFRDLPIMENAVEVIEALHKEYELFIVTAAMGFPHSFVDKYNWLKEHFPFIDHKHYVFCGHKYMIQADYLIDDNSYNFKGFAGQGLLFSAPHNSKETEGDFKRVDNWLEIKELLLSKKNLL